jgi:hypothetical protein
VLYCQLTQLSDELVAATNNDKVTGDQQAKESVATAAESNLPPIHGKHRSGRDLSFNITAS